MITEGRQPYIALKTVEEDKKKKELEGKIVINQWHIIERKPNKPNTMQWKPSDK